ncbi:MAG TPA: SCO family protein [Thermoanaerobaculia bacterium]|nr:SCO family protein [Thermoanaerobaculia bacterium]
MLHNHSFDVMLRLTVIALLLAAPAALAQHDDHGTAHHAHAAEEEKAPPMRIADVPVVDQSGNAKRFYSELVKDRIVAMNFIFTSCTTICPTLGANFAKVQSLLGESGRDVSLISISIDPVNDTPARLAAWSTRLGGKPGWTLVTGEGTDIDALLKSIGAFTPDKNDHGPLVVLGDDRTGRWQRMNAFAAPAKIVEALQTLEKERTAAANAAAASAAAQYFGALPLVDQNGRTVDLYSDLIRGRTVVINAFFADCKNTCPIMANAYRAIQGRFPDRIGRDLALISITVDPKNDTPPRLKSLATQLEAKEGWYFLSGTEEQVGAALRKIGLFAQNPEGHSNLFLIGNDRTGLWKKALGVANLDEVVEVVNSVVNDPVAPSPTATP